MLYIANYMPSYLADNSSGNCYDLRFCPSFNYTRWAEHVVDWINRSTRGDSKLQSIIWVEVWNEPDNDFLLQKESQDSSNKTVEYIKMYNATQTAIKAFNSNIKVGGPGLTFTTSPKLLNSTLANFSNRLDFVSFHTYQVPTEFYWFDDAIRTQTGIVERSCAGYNANCSHIILSEFNVNNQMMKNMTVNQSLYGLEIALAYYQGLQQYSSNYTFVFYDWTENRNYTSGQKYEMVSEPKWSNTYYAPYNITKSFKNHNFSSYISNSTQTDNIVKSLVSNTGARSFYITLVNQDNAILNMSVRITNWNDANNNVTTLMDINTGQIYTDTGSDTYTVGVMQPYEIRTLYAYDTPVADATVYESSSKSYCDSFASGVSVFSDKFSVIFIILGGILVMSVIGGLMFFVYRIQNEGIEMLSEIPLGLITAIILGLFGLFVFAFVGMLALEFTCNLF